MKIYELIPTNGRKSFYGKAKVIECEGENFLQSYNAIVCKVDKNGKFVKMWDGYSATTMSHINDFVKLFNIDGGGKKWYESLEIQSDTSSVLPIYDSLKIMYGRRNRK